jgi:hypothetical protein
VQLIRSPSAMASSTICLPGTVNSTPACASGVDGPFGPRDPTALSGVPRGGPARWVGGVLHSGATLGIISGSDHEDGDLHR